MSSHDWTKISNGECDVLGCTSSSEYVADVCGVTVSVCFEHCWEYAAPSTVAEHLKPTYKRLVDAQKEKGWK